jgi:hypothetical protein
MRTNSLEKWVLGEVNKAEMSLVPLSSFQQALLDLAHRLNQQITGEPATPLPLLQTEHEAAIHIIKSLDSFSKH